MSASASVWRPRTCGRQCKRIPANMFRAHTLRAHMGRHWQPKAKVGHLQTMTHTRRHRHVPPAPVAAQAAPAGADKISGTPRAGASWCLARTHAARALAARATAARAPARSIGPNLCHFRWPPELGRACKSSFVASTAHGLRNICLPASGESLSRWSRRVRAHSAQSANLGHNLAPGAQFRTWPPNGMQIKRAS